MQLLYEYLIRSSAKIKFYILLYKYYCNNIVIEVFVLYYFESNPTQQLSVAPRSRLDFEMGYASNRNVAWGIIFFTGLFSHAAAYYLPGVNPQSFAAGDE